jgi:stage II sporulation protein AA (anti-sigma F factor antagonist)
MIVTPQDQLDTNSAPDVEKVLTDHIKRGETRIVIDLSHVGYISSMGLRAILNTVMAIIRKDGKVVLCGGNDQVLNVLRLSGGMIMALHTPTLEEATARIQA